MIAAELNYTGAWLPALFFVCFKSFDFRLPTSPSPLFWRRQQEAGILGYYQDLFRSTDLEIGSYRTRATEFHFSN